MKFIETPLAGCYVVELEKRGDDRGFFARAWCQNEFADLGLPESFVQVNMSASSEAGTLRGFHWQVEPHAEAKYVRCVKGSIFDVAIDVRPDSPTYTQWFGVELSASNRSALFVPAGFAHGYQTLGPDTELLYQSSAFYAPEAERGARWDDPLFGVEWPIATPTLSEKDQSWPNFVP